MAVANLLGRRVVSATRIHGGRNSRVFRVVCDDGSVYAAKTYFRHPSDPRDRLDVEFRSLEFLWSGGVRCVPRPVAADRDRGWAVYEYVEGRGVPSHDVTVDDIDRAAGFLGTLAGFRDREGSRTLPAASEACFSVQGILDSIGGRLDRLSQVTASDQGNADLQAFLDRELVPYVEEATGWATSRTQAAGMTPDSELDPRNRTLSPSDFGFHNALRLDDGRLVFVDFEYFGWDDPAKMVADFLLHPGMELSQDLKERFAVEVLGRFADDPLLPNRLQTVYPLFGLKWCLILLNEFVPEHLMRRGFATDGAEPRPEIQARQLAKARGLLRRVQGEYREFPYHG